MKKKHKKLLARILVALALFGGVFAAEKLTALPNYIYLILYLIPYFIAGYDVLLKSARNILHGRIFDECFLMTVATVGALIIGEYPESVFVMVFYQTGELFQSLAVEKSRRSISDLMALCPDTAVRLDENGAEEEILPEEAAVGDTLLLRPGDKVPVDGVVLTGESALDTAALTGESAPMEVKPGDALISGCVNLSGVVRMKVTAEFGESAVSKILELIENAGANKAKSEEFITKFARVYTPAVVIGAALLALIPSLLFKDPVTWCYRALIFLVVSCPCALVISVPLAYFGGVGGASAKGILIKGGNYLEALADVKTAVFDKTGTLTRGQFRVSRCLPAQDVTEETLLSLTARAEYYSTHPIALSLRAAAGESPLPPEKVTERSGYGIEALIDGKTVLAGNAGLMAQENIACVPAPAGATAVYTAADGKYLGCILLEDLPKENAKAALEALTAEGVRTAVMLTGDRPDAAAAAAQRLGISEVHAGLLPQDKVAKVDALCSAERKGERLFFVGDGVNDAPVLTRADVGIAMGALGSDAAIEAADVVIMDDDLMKLPLALRIAKKTRRIVRENVIFALGVKFAVLLFAAFGLTNMWAGVLADVGVAVIAILNSMRMQKK